MPLPSRRRHPPRPCHRSPVWSALHIAAPWRMAAARLPRRRVAVPSCCGGVKCQRYGTYRQRTYTTVDSCGMAVRQWGSAALSGCQLWFVNNPHEAARSREQGWQR
ncbi:hypothetical protein BS78_05G262000 [Paspalum vaginatum]|nr:hypothetical protein BS78_05G262000 [Paspalum vaginatum]